MSKATKVNAPITASRGKDCLFIIVAMLVVVVKEEVDPSVGDDGVEVINFVGVVGTGGMANFNAVGDPDAS